MKRLNPRGELDDVVSIYCEVLVWIIAAFQVATFAATTVVLNRLFGIQIITALQKALAYLLTLRLEDAIPLVLAGVAVLSIVIISVQLCMTYLGDVYRMPAMWIVKRIMRSKERRAE